MSRKRWLMFLRLRWGGLLGAGLGLQAVLAADTLRFGLGAGGVLLTAATLTWWGARWRRGCWRRG